MRLGWAAQGPAAILARGASRVPNAAAQTRIVSGGRFGPAKGQVYHEISDTWLAHGFPSSSMPSQAVRSRLGNCDRLTSRRLMPGMG
jgi:hypothetical protein